MNFSHVAEYFQKIEQESSRTQMTKLLADLFGQANEQEIGIIANLALGQLQPPYLGMQFNLAEKNVIKALALVLDESQHHVAGLAQELGDLGLVIQSGDWKTEKNLTVQQVYRRLRDLQEITGTGSQEDKINDLAALLRELDPVSAKFVVRIILGKLRMGFSDMTIIDALSWMSAGNKSLKPIIENAYNLCVDIGYIATELKQNGVRALEHMHVQIGIPIRPSAAERLPTAQEIVDKLGDCIAQPKLDGFRVQVHVKKTGHGHKPQVHFFSRNLLDMSHMFPDLTAAVEELPVHELICEGEAIVYDTNTNTFLPFQETVKRKRKHDIESVAQEFPLRLFIFDILYLDGKELLNETHQQRRKLLLSIVKNDKDDVVQVIDEKKITSGPQLQNYFEHNISSGLEGLVVKRPDAIYQPGKRNFNWIKLKRQSGGELEDTIDCVILGYYAGRGKRASFGVGAFLVGVYDKTHDRFESIAKIGTGMTDAEWKDLKKRCDAIAVPYHPKNVFVAKELEPDVWVNPEMVCIVFADEITVSPLHTAGKTETHSGYALRFPRFMGYSVEKSATDATSVSEIIHLFNDQFHQKK